MSCVDVPLWGSCCGFLERVRVGSEEGYPVVGVLRGRYELKEAGHLLYFFGFLGMLCVVGVGGVTPLSLGRRKRTPPGQ